MNAGTQAAKEAGNMVDLDSDPAKLLAVVEVGKQLLITRGALTTFSLANDVAKYFAILPAVFASSLPMLAAFDVLRLSSPTNAVLATLIFNALIIPALVPLALRGVAFKPSSGESLLRRNLLAYGVGGVLLPFPAIKLIDLLLSSIGG
jgi:K+-transporting ATPase ATPase B chain